MGLTGFGLLFLFLGMLFFFDSFLLAMGNLLFLAGLSTTVGFKRSLKFFTKRGALKGTCAFFAGIALVLYGWPLIGMVFEAYGFVALFADFMPTALIFLKKVPGLKTLLDAAPVKNVRHTERF